MRIFKRRFSPAMISQPTWNSLSLEVFRDQDNQGFFYSKCLASQNLSLRRGFSSVMTELLHVQIIYWGFIVIIWSVTFCYKCISAHLFALQDSPFNSLCWFLKDLSIRITGLFRHRIHHDVLVQSRCWFSAQHTHPVYLYCLNIYTAHC